MLSNLEVNKIRGHRRCPLILASQDFSINQNGSVFVNGPHLLSLALHGQAMKGCIGTCNDLKATRTIVAELTREPTMVGMLLLSGNLPEKEGSVALYL